MVGLRHRKKTSKNLNISNMTTIELAEVCQKGNFVALVSRNDEDNTRYAAELCKDVNQIDSGVTLYFSLKEESKDFRSAFPKVLVEIDDTPAVSIEELEYKVKNKNRVSKISMIVVDHLCLMTTHNTCLSIRAQNEEILLKLKQLLVQEKISVLALLPLSRYAPIDYSIKKELETYYGDFTSWVDFIVEVIPDMICFQNRKNWVHIEKNDNTLCMGND